MSSWCPYCSLAVKHGELYCSRHGNDMHLLQSGVFYIREKSFDQCDAHITRLSLNFNLDNKQSYFTGKREHVVSPSRFLLINEGESFTTFAKGENESRMITIAFKVGLAQDVFHSLSNQQHTLIDEVRHPDRPLEFFQQTYAIDEYLRKAAMSLCAETSGSPQGGELDEQLESILVHVLQQQLNLANQVNKIGKVKASTRREVYRRLERAYAYIHENYTQAITVDAIADEACLSAFNFKRLFRAFYQQAPYQMIKSLRLNHARQLLRQGMAVAEACKASGWQDASSFIRTFRNVEGVTPEQYKREMR